MSAAVLLLMMTWGRLKRLRLYSRKAMVRKGRGAVSTAGPAAFLMPNRAIMIIWKNSIAVMMCWKICIHNCTPAKNTFRYMMFLVNAGEALDRLLKRTRFLAGTVCKQVKQSL